MKNLTKVLLIAVFAFAIVPNLAGKFSGAVFAQDDPCNDIYEKKFKINRKPNPDLALQNAKEYLANKVCTDNVDNEAIVKYLRDWVIKKENEDDVKRKYDRFNNALAATPINDVEVIASGKVLLNLEPDSLEIVLSIAGSANALVLAKNTSYNGDFDNYTKTAIRLIESGKVLESWSGSEAAKKAIALANLNYNLAFVAFQDRENYRNTKATPAVFIDKAKYFATLKTSADYFYKALQFNAPKIKANYVPYYVIAFNYKEIYAAASDDYDAGLGKLPEATDESKAALAQVNGIIDRTMDAYSRAYKVANDAKVSQKDTIYTTLSDFYKARKKEVKSLPAYIDATNKTPMINPNTPIAPAVMAAPPTTPMTKPTTTPTTPMTKPTTTPTTPATTPMTKPTTKPAVKPVVKKPVKKPVR